MLATTTTRVYSRPHLRFRLLAMADARGRVIRFLDDDNYRVPGFSSSRETQPLRYNDDLPRHHGEQYIPSAASRAFSSASTISTASIDGQSDTMSRATSNSTRASSVSSTFPLHPIQTLNQQIATTTLPNHGYNLPCIFEAVDCHLTFPATSVEEWIEHSYSHFIKVPPPPKSICIFCDDDNAVFISRGDPYETWRLKMMHILGHLQDYDPPHIRRPDFLLIDYLSEHGLISQEDYSHSITYTERPDCDGLVGYDFVTPERERERLNQERMQRAPYDLDKERRAMRKRRSKEPKNARKNVPISQKQPKVQPQER